MKVVLQVVTVLSLVRKRLKDAKDLPDDLFWAECADAQEEALKQCPSGAEEITNFVFGYAARLGRHFPTGITH